MAWYRLITFVVVFKEVDLVPAFDQVAEVHADQAYQEPSLIQLVEQRSNTTGKIE